MLSFGTLWSFYKQRCSGALSSGKSSSTFSGILGETLHQVWLRLRYKHRQTSKRTALHVLRGTARACVWTCDCVCTAYLCPCTHTVRPHTCGLVSLWAYEQGCLPKPAPFPSCVCLMIKAPAMPPLLLMLWHNRACWGIDFFIHSAP